HPALGADALHLQAAAPRRGEVEPARRAQKVHPVAPELHFDLAPHPAGGDGPRGFQILLQNSSFTHKKAARPKRRTASNQNAVQSISTRIFSSTRTAAARMTTRMALAMRPCLPMTRPISPSATLRW